MKNTILLSVLASVVATAAIGCGGKDPFKRESNPTSNYPGLENSVAPHEEKPRNQFYVSDVFDVAFEEQQESRRILNFVEGQSTSQKVRARVYMDGIGFSLKPSNLPKGATFEKSAEEGIWVLSWKPEFGFIPANQNEKQVDIQIELVPTVNPGYASNTSLPSQIERTVHFTLMVRHTEAEPTIVSVKGLKGDISEKKAIPFKVEVSDPASYKGAAPELFWGYDRTLYSKDSKVYSGQSGIDWASYDNKKPKQLDNGNWEYSLVYYPSVVASLHGDNAKDGKLKVQFSLQAASTASEELSPAYSHPLNIVLDTQAGGTK